MPQRRGPKPSGKTETVLARVSPETRAQLEAAAEANGVSMSREIEERLVRSLTADGAQGEGVGPETEALLFALRIVIERVEELTGQPWQKDGFTRDAAADAVGCFIRYLKPDKGPPPDTFPRGIAEWAGEDLRREAADELIALGVGRRCAEDTVRAMVTPLPNNVLGRFVADHGWRSERIAARGLAKLFRVNWVDEKGIGNDK